MYYARTCHVPGAQRSHGSSSSEASGVVRPGSGSRKASRVDGIYGSR